MRIVRRLRLEMGFVTLALLAAVFGAALVMFLLYGHVRAVDQKHRQLAKVQAVAQEVGGHLDRMHQGVSVIDQTAESVAGLSRKNYDSLQLLDEQIAGFRT